MEKKIALRIGLVIIFAFISLGVLLSSSKSITPSDTKACKESMQECCKKEKDTDASGNIDFESLPGKFFSSVFIN